MAHCDARMSNAVNLTSPTVAVRIRVDKALAGTKNGLGCVSNGTLVACTAGGDPAVQSNLVVYDGDGNRVWEDRGQLGPTAWMSAPLISDAGIVIAADQSQILRADPLAGTVVWRSAKPDSGIPISPVLIGSGLNMVLVAPMSADDGGLTELSVWDANTGSLLAHGPIVDPATGVTYHTMNTPSVVGNRAYVLTSAAGSPRDGRLYAIDICESSVCGGRGAIKPAWYFGFNGPSGASPLVIGKRIFFDGLRGEGAGTYFAVDDRGMNGARVWKAQFGGRFGFNAAQDPRGGLWVSPWNSGIFLRLNEDTGLIDQTVVVSSVLGLAPGYTPVTAVSVSRTAAQGVVLTFGAQTNGQTASIGPHVAAIDVSTTPSGVALWKYKVSSSAAINSATGQFPIVTGSSGSRRIVFKGSLSSTYFIGEP